LSVALVANPRGGTQPRIQRQSVRPMTMFPAAISPEAVDGGQGGEPRVALSGQTPS
jgi:hypothetical protein